LASMPSPKATFRPNGTLCEAVAAAAGAVMDGFLW
jgi:hypothetical protein